MLSAASFASISNGCAAPSSTGGSAIAGRFDSNSSTGCAGPPNSPSATAVVASAGAASAGFKTWVDGAPSAVDAESSPNNASSDSFSVTPVNGLDSGGSPGCLSVPVVSADVPVAAGEEAMTGVGVAGSGSGVERATAFPSGNFSAIASRSSESRSSASPAASATSESVKGSTNPSSTGGAVFGSDLFTGGADTIGFATADTAGRVVG